MWAITSVQDTPERTHVAGGLVDSLAWVALRVVNYCTAVGQVEDDSPDLVRLDNLPVRARARLVVDLSPSGK